MNMFEALKEMVPVYNVRSARGSFGLPQPQPQHCQAKCGQRARYGRCLRMG